MRSPSSDWPTSGSSSISITLRRLLGSKLRAPLSCRRRRSSSGSTLSPPTYSMESHRTLSRRPRPWVSNMSGGDEAPDSVAFACLGRIGAGPPVVGEQRKFTQPSPGPALPRSCAAIALTSARALRPHLERFPARRGRGHLELRLIPSRDDRAAAPLRAPGDRDHRRRAHVRRHGRPERLVGGPAGAQEHGWPSIGWHRGHVPDSRP